MSAAFIPEMEVPQLWNSTLHCLYLGRLKLSLSFSPSVSVSVSLSLSLLYIYIYIYTHISMNECVRERERDRCEIPRAVQRLVSLPAPI